MAVPKIIHYCWFGGGEKNALTRRCINSWRKYCPDFEIVEWNEDNFDVNAIRYTREAYDSKRWSFVSDYARLKVLYEQGGIYFDTDVELIKPIDSLLAGEGFMGFEASGGSIHEVNTGLGFGAVKGNPVIKALLDSYEDMVFIKEEGSLNLTPCPENNTAVLAGLGLRADGGMQTLYGIQILPAEYLCPENFYTGEKRITEKTMAVHHYASSWKTPYERVKLKAKRLMGEKLYWLVVDTKNSVLSHLKR